jgi:hypothetical protein
MAQQLINIGSTANDGKGTNWRTAWEYTNDNFTELFTSVESLKLNNRVVVKSASDLSGTLDSAKDYFIDGVIDMGSQSIEVPAGGLSISGYNLKVSKLASTASSYTMFTSPVGGSGDVIFKDLSVDVSGSNSKVYDIKGATGFEGVEIVRLNYDNCSSLGTIDSYRQGFETGTGRFGGTPELELAGNWLGGYFIDSSIVRSINAGIYSLFKAGAGLTFGSRFRSNQNIDLPTGVGFMDFAPVNFPNPSTLQLAECIVTRNSVVDATDAGIIPNISASDLASDWHSNNGIKNTFVGGELDTTTEVVTTISTAGVFVDLNGIYTSSDLQHFDVPASGQLRHLGSSPREFSLSGQFVIDGTANDEIDLKIVVFRSSTSTFEDSKTQRRVVSNLVGGRDVAYFSLASNIILDQNDYVKIQVANVGATNNVTSELDSYFNVRAR